MKTTVEKLSPTRTKLTISVTPEELQPSIKHAYEHIAGQVNIPGFRKGKVPPAIIDQRVGKEAVLEHAVNEGLDGFYRLAVEENEVRPLGRPEADISEWPNEKDFSGDLLLTIEVDVRPEITLPAFDGITLTVEAAQVTPDDVEEELDRLRSRFCTLVTVDRPAKKGDFAQIDLVAEIGGEEVDTAANISYEIGSGELIEGIDEALDTLTAGETTTFEAPLMGGDHEGENAQITVTLNAVKERELPEADDDFAQISSEFDTIGELRESLRGQVERAKSFGQGTAARDQLVEKLLELVEIPVPAQLVEDEVSRHLEQESRLEDDEHRAEVTESSEKTFRTQILLDEIAQRENVKVSQDELTQYLVQGAAQYNMDPNEFVKILGENGQISSMVGEIARNKALAIVLGKAEVVDTNGKQVDLTEFVALPDDGEAVDEDATPEDTDAPAEEAPAAEKPKKKAAAKKKAADK
ncbi:trigger factor [Leifsonia xyli subsp. xyli]|uniref:Trigger factor n=2 Tax=Leifsonia xyli subsp. xyli TaxID=59736 RepID=TIG_LEIXX|nr:trigger factor [Leifsonia xyli]Q6AG00.1 RecName: Full=Trigger factor; Short=TF; AltName: Full=PPIase [Leifsonia xyli subsp. xyli str. CTCB07]AAT88695.1 FKBP-type peptidyl-prolyl cis-trans isomerase [Leifsonia xyli subsp. xyli str. CTCB07]ODA91101.1 trigger factor [Leifsonia xyli subsp. xyli]